MVSVKLPLESRTSLETAYAECIPGYESVLDLLAREIRDAAAAEKLSVTVRHRVKSFESWYGKVLKLAASAGDSAEIRVTDILGIRIVCPFLEEVELVSDLLRSRFIVDEFEIKGADYPASHFGYESVHFLVRLPESISNGCGSDCSCVRLPVCEIQVRTILQEAWAEVEHELVYKSDFTPLDEPLKRKLAALNANLTLSDLMFQEIRDYQRHLHSALRQRRKDFYDRLRLEPDTDSEPSSAEQIPVSRETVDSLLLKGLLAHNSGDYGHAVEIYSEILKRNLKNDIRAVILTHRGMAYFSAGLPAPALDDFCSALNHNPGYSKARYYKAVHARTSGNYAAAFRELDECLEAEPYNAEYLTARAETLAAAGEADAASDACRKVLRLEPGFKPAERLLRELDKT